MIRKVCNAAVIVMLGLIMQYMANIAAYAERGYEAHGGEMLVFPMVILCGYMFCRFNHWVDREEASDDDF